MHLIHLLPYEILQLISSQLLPKYQCRLALASKWCYRYLYNDLLRWHAKWRWIAPPKYKLYIKGRYDSLSLTQYNKKLIMRDECYLGVYTVNLTTMYEIRVNNCKLVYNEYRLRSVIEYYQFNIFAGYYKYMNKNAILLTMRMMNPFLKFSMTIDQFVFPYLSLQDCINVKRSSDHFYSVSY